MLIAMNPGLSRLQPYPFERLSALQAGLGSVSALSPINLSIGEPQHPTPQLIHDALIAALPTTSKYPVTKGSDELRQAIAGWLGRRYRLPATAIDPASAVLPVNGTREALFAIAQCVTNREADRALIAMPNPFYQIYEGAALLAGAEPYFLPCPADSGFLPDLTRVPATVWRRCQLVYVCSPANPSGAVMSPAQFLELLALADRYNFVVVSDECYSELYFDEDTPPAGLLGVAWHAGRTDFKRCLVMHSLSKRSNAPGLRSGFVAGEANLIKEFLRYRTYHGSAMPLHVQRASIAAWNDEAHVVDNRRLYREKFATVVPLLQDVIEVEIPAGGFYLWPKLPGDDLELCKRLIANANVTTLPGQFLARPIQGVNPGAERIRIALVPPLATCIEATHRIRQVLSEF